MTWLPYAQGKTLGTTGSEGGVIKNDEEYTGAARITLEEGCLHAPYAITCNVATYLLHTRFLADDETALYAIDEMKPALAKIADLLPDDDDEDWSAALEAVTEAAVGFTRRFP